MNIDFYKLAEKNNKVDKNNVFSISPQKIKTNYNDMWLKLKRLK